MNQDHILFPSQDDVQIRVEIPRDSTHESMQTEGADLEEILESTEEVVPEPMEVAGTEYAQTDADQLYTQGGEVFKIIRSTEHGAEGAVIQIQQASDQEVVSLFRF